jgi:hypothetical protein
VACRDRSYHFSGSTCSQGQDQAQIRLMQRLAEARVR